MDDQALEHQLLLLDQYQSACTRCGLCSEGCVTFQASGWEQESPRGRIQLAQDLLNGKIQPASAALETFDRCLGCHACESLCPLGVPYGKIRHLVQELRTQLNPHRISQLSSNTYRQWVRTAKRLSSIWWRQVKRMINYSGSALQRYGKDGHPQPEEITLVFGCLQETVHPGVIESAINCLKWLGYHPHLSKEQPCCGAIFERLAEGGEESISYPSIKDKAAHLQSKRLQDFVKWLPDQSYSLSMGCLCHVNRKQSQPLIQDVHALILETLTLKDVKLRMAEPITVYYQPFCGSKKGELDPVLKVFERIENLKVRMVNHPSACCGGYGGGNLCSSQDTSMWAACQLKGIPENAIVIVLSPECHQQVSRYCQTMKVLYPIQLVWQAMSQRIQHKEHKDTEITKKNTETKYN